MKFEESIVSLWPQIDRLCKEERGIHAPSEPWAKAIEALSFIRRLPPSDLRNIRYHCAVINGDNPFEYWCPEVDAAAEARRLRFGEFTAGVPDRWVLSEPPVPSFPFPFGVSLEGKTLNYNTVRMQCCVSDLWSVGELDRVESSKGNIVEIGGGYGALAGHLGSRLGNYFLIDIPELFYFQVPYLLASYPGLSVKIFDGTPKDADVTLVPNFLADRLDTRFDLAINMQSFMEMTDEQIAFYCNFLRDKLDGFLYSSNVDRVPHNPSLQKTVTDHLYEHFILSPDPLLYDAVLEVDKHWSCKYRRYLASTSQSLNLDFSESDGNGQIVGGIMKPVQFLLDQEKPSVTTR